MQSRLAGLSTPPETVNLKDRYMADEHSVQCRDPGAIVNLTTEVVVERGDAEVSVDGLFLLLGSGGAWIEMAGQYPIDSEVALCFKLPTGGSDIACRAVVRNHMRRRGAGIEFVDITPHDRARRMARCPHRHPEARVPFALRRRGRPGYDSEPL